MGAGALIGAIIGGATFAVGSTLLGTTLMSSVLMGAALGSIFDRRRAQPGSPTYEFGELMNTRSQAMPVPIIYGRVRVAGNIIYHRVSDDQKTLYMAVGLGEGPIQDVSDIRVNDTPISEIKGAEYRVYLGTADQQADPWVHTGERWPYTAYIVCKFTANEQVSSTPTITCVVEGRKVPVWTGSQWLEQYTNNPAWVILDFLRNTRYGVGIEDSRIDFDSFRAEAQYCDELVDDGKGGREPRFRLDYVIDYERSSLDVLEDMLATFRAFLLYSDGKLRLKVEKSEAPVYAFDMDNIVEGSFVYSKASRKDIPNQIRVEWIDPEADWERSETVYDNEIDQDRRGEVYSRTISLFGITRPGQAGRMARFYHDSAFWANTFCEFRVGIDALHVEVGDVIQISHDVPGWDRKLFRVLEIAEEETDEATLRCREYVPAIYHDRGVPYQPGKETTLPNPIAPPPHVTNLSVTEASRIVADGTVVPVIRVTWTEPVAAFYAGAIVYWRRVAESAWRRSELSEAPSYDIILAEPGQYQVRVVSQNRNGIRAPFDTAPEANITVSTVIPGDVTGLRVEFSGPDAVISWNPVPRAYRYRLQILDPATDVVKRSEEVAGTTYRYTYAQNAADFGGNGSPTIKVSVEARNEAENYSRQPAIVQATCPVLPRPEVTVRSDRAEIRWVVTSEVGATWRSTTVSVGTFTQTAPVLSGVIDAESAGLSDGDLATVIVRFNDVFGRSSETREVQVTVKYIDKLAFARDLRAVELVSALPELPNPDYPQGAIVFLTTDNQLYRSTGTAWVVEVPAEVKDGSITTAKLAAGAVTSDKLAANSVTAGAIAAGAVRADAISANAIQADHIQNDTIESRHIKAEAIESKHIQAGAVESDHIKANAIEAQHIQSGAIEASHIKVGDPLDRAVKNVNASRLPNAVPPGAHLFHFDNSLQSTRGLRPLPGYVATLRPGEGRFGGAVAVEEGTTNLVPSNRLKFEGWTASSGAQVTLTQNVEFPEIGRNDATRIRTTGGTSNLKYYTPIETSTADQAYTGSVYIKNIGSKPVRFGTQLGPSVTVNPGEWTRAIVSGIGNGTTNFQLHFEALNVDDDLDFIAWGPQAERKPFATSFVDGTRAAGVLRYPQLLDKKRGTLSVWINPHVVVNWNNFFSMNLSTGRFLLFFGANGSSCWDFGPSNSGPRAPAGTIVAGQWAMHTLTWDADAGVYRYYVNGEFVGERQYVEPDSLPSALPTVNNYGALIDELLILPYAASEEEIWAWYELQAPFYDTDDRVAADLPGGHVITFDSSGMKMQPHNVPQRTMHLDGKMLGFWDPNGEPSIGIGDVREMAQHFNSTMQYGLLIAQGEIRATESVLRESFISGTIQDIHLAPGTVNNSVIEDESVDGDKLVPGTVGLYQLNEFLQVPSTNSITLRRYGPTGSGSVTLERNVWRTVLTATVAKRSESQGYVMEVCKVNFEAQILASNESAVARLHVNGVPVASFDITSRQLYGAIIDTRTLPDGNVSFLLEAMNTGSKRFDFQCRNFTIYQNDQLPIRWGKPHYTFEGVEAGGCFETCEVTCEAKCQKTCQTSCQSKCQSGCQTSCQEQCQTSCQSTCQKTSQGGGCLRDGTPITIWDPDTKEYLELPIEALKPGMILPAYNPVTDSIERGELIELIDALYSHKFIRIHTDVGPSVDVTYSQPFDVLADLGYGLQWYKIQAKYLKPGMKMARPFDDPDKRIATITKVEEVVERNTHFWNLRTSHGRFIAAGYADQTKLPY